MGTDAACATLGIAAGAPADEITRAFRAHCRAHHPDRGGDRRTFERIVDAYRTLQRSARAVAQPTSPPSPPPSSSARHYRAFLRDLDRVATIVIPPAPRRPRPNFGDVLDAALARIAA